MSTSRRTLGISVPITELLDPTLWRERYAFGVVLGSPGQRIPIRERLARLAELKGQPDPTGALEALRQNVVDMPPETIRWHLRAALSELEVNLQVPMGVVVYKSPAIDAGLVQGVHYDKVFPRRPYMNSDARNWYKIDLPGSVISVERIRAYYYSQVIWEFSAAQGNADLIRTEWPTAGGVHLLPTNFQSIVVQNALEGGNYGVWHLLQAQHTPVPDFWAVDWTQGPVDKYGACSQIEAVLADWVYAVAGVKILSMAGLARSQGLTSSSVSMDGVSRSVSLQASAIYGLNSALEEVLRQTQKRIDWKRMRAYKQGLRILPYGS